ncbi:chemotaxis protein [Mycetohabitans sp. B8]|uniref:chemotaxis protein n=1 Tax=Mycetohabitans sp. B8 TaxID=2841845 RepID=UPI001F42EE1D|nr:chemotaxis protein [Mycetohabitans sp. B8]
MNSTLDPDNDLPQPYVPGHDTEALGPGDSSDTGSDTVGAKRHDFDRDTELDNHALETGIVEQGSDTDSAGTGERAAADGDETIAPNADVMPDRIDHVPSQDRVHSDLSESTDAGVRDR